MNISLAVLIGVFLLIAIRQIGSLRLRIWQIMCAGAAIVLITNQITIAEAARSINLDVMFFLFGMFTVGYALEASGLLAQLSSRIFGSSTSVDILLVMILVVFGILSALLMNDTLAIIGTPVVLGMARRHHISPVLLLLALAFAVTVGSVVSPIGNPQNLLIAITGTLSNPFVVFGRYLFLPTLINLTVTYFTLRLFFKQEFHSTPIVHPKGEVSDKNLASVARSSLILIVALILFKTIALAFGSHIDIKLTYIAIAAAVPVYLLSPRRLEILKRIDWATLLFFAAMFILMASVWRTGFFQDLIARNLLHPNSLAAILVVSTIVSQFISNVPLVALYLPILLNSGAGERELIALAAGSTIAGNLLILGAASNIIIIQNAEQRFRVSLNFFQFARVGIPLTIIQALIYWLFLRFV